MSDRRESRQDRLAPSKERKHIVIAPIIVKKQARPKTVIEKRKGRRWIPREVVPLNVLKEEAYRAYDAAEKKDFFRDPYMYFVVTFSRPFDSSHVRSFLESNFITPLEVMGEKTAKETLLIAINRGEQDAHLDLRLASNKLTPIFVTRGETDSVKTQTGAVGVEVTLPPLTGAVFSYQ